MGITMNTLMTNLVESTNLSEDQVRECTKALVDQIRKELTAEGGSVTITGLGTFKSVKKGDRMARNPRTGEQSYVDPYLKVKFSASNLMNDVVNKRR